MRLLPPWLLLIATACMLKGQEDKDPFGLDEKPGIAAADRSTAEITATTRGSLVVVTQKGRDGQTAGTGSGFAGLQTGLPQCCGRWQRRFGKGEWGCGDSNERRRSLAPGWGLPTPPTLARYS